MNCIEVGELMQRNLDNDLNEQELTILMQHLDECMSCSQLFEKLTLLSGSLDQLPRVTPSISIVDAILPELERIDQQKLMEQQTSVKKKGSRMRWYTSLGSIAAAAVVIITMVSINGLPNSSNQNSSVALEESMQRSMLKQTADTSSDMAASSGSAYSAQESGESSADSALPMAIFDKYVPESSNGIISQFGMQGESTPPFDPTTKATYQDQSQEKINDRAITDAIDNDGVPDRAQPRNDLQGADNAMKEDKGPVMGVATESTVSDPFEAASLLNFSPNEQVYLLFEEHTISVYESSTGELIQQWQKLMDGQYQFGEWADDSSYFTYTVVNSDGETHSYSERLVYNE